MPDIITENLKCTKDTSNLWVICIFFYFIKKRGMQMNIFYNFHPAVSAVYFASVLLITMFSGNPFLAAVSLFGGAIFYVISEKKHNRIKEFGFYLLVFIVVSVSNPLFTHKGKTVLFFINSNPN